MKRLVIGLLSLLAAALVAAPARAYCVVNQTPVTLVAALQSASPLGDFRKTVNPGKKICCDWFSRKCNPAGKRDALVPLVIESPDRKKEDTLPGLDTHYEPIQTYDRYGNPDPDGHYDRFGVYDEHGHKPYFERIQTFDRHGNPDPRGHYDRYGVYDAHGHRGRRGELIIPKNRQATTVPDISESDRSHFCVRGRSRSVLASADGTVTVTVHARSPGGLRCESRDRFLRPIAPPSQATEFGVPLLDLPSRASPSGRPRSGN